MKRVLLLVTVLAMLFLTACNPLSKNERLFITPHHENLRHNTDEIREVETYLQMRQVLEGEIEIGATELVVSVSSFDPKNADYYVKTAIDYIMNKTPLGAYAVNSISYEIGKNRGESVIAFRMDYRYGIGEIMRIKTAENMQVAGKHIETALTECEDSVVFLVNNYEATDIAQYVADYANDYPDLVMEQPQVRVTVYPDSGEKRIVEVSFTYQNSRADLRKMREIVEDVFTAAKLYVQQTKAKESYSRLYYFLMERNEYTLETSLTPAYSLLHYGVGDSRAFANVYAAMCRRTDLDCRVVSGMANGEPRCWNIIRYNGKDYHLDLLQCSINGKFEMLLEKQMSGYVWDYSAFE